MFRFTFSKLQQFFSSSLGAFTVLAAVVAFSIVLAFLLTGKDQAEAKSTEKHRGTRLAVEFDVSNYSSIRADREYKWSDTHQHT